MQKKRRCPNEHCGHAEYTDDSDRTCTPEPFCPACMKLLIVPDPWVDTRPGDYEEVY